MRIEDNILTTLQWLLPQAGEYWGGLLVYGSALVVLIFFGLLGGYILSTIRNGPFEAFYNVFGTAVQSVPEFLSISPRRVWAMTWLAFQEAIRKKALVAFGLFVLIMLFAGWFIEPSADEPVRIYLSFLFNFPRWLVLLLAVLLSVFSLPEDIKRKTIYTIYTKPVLPSEIFLGRLFGFLGVGTLVLVAMGVVSYVFLSQALNHSHDVVLDSLREDEEGNLIGETTLNSGHRHEVLITPDGVGQTNRENQHIHMIEQRGERDGEPNYVVHNPTEMFQARVRQTGKLRFLDRTGNPTSKGIDVGHEWQYYSHVEGQTLSAAIFEFEGVDESFFTDGLLPVEFNINVFRTFMGDIESGIRGDFYFVNPDTEQRTAPIPFTASEEADLKLIPRQQPSYDAESGEVMLDLLDDIADNPRRRMELRITCAERGQYLGVGSNSVYILKANRSFTMNFIKCYLGIWFQVVMVITFGLVFSTFLNGPVALLASAIAMLYGIFARDVRGLANSLWYGAQQTGWYGGGPLEAMVRLFSQKNIMIDLPDSAWVFVVQKLDNVFLFVIWVVVNMLPDYAMLDAHLFLVEGYDIPAAVVLQQFLTVLGFFFALVAVGYFFLKSKEIAA